MNTPNKITLTRIVLSLFIILLLLFPFDAAGITIPQLFINESIVVDIRYFIAGVVFVIASLTDFVDGHLARKYNQVTDFGKMIDAIADVVSSGEAFTLFFFLCPLCLDISLPPFLIDIFIITPYRTIFNTLQCFLFKIKKP